MAGIDGMGNISNEQLMAMSLMSNGQITNDSTSSTGDETNLAFQLMMQNLMKSSTDSSKESINKASEVISSAQNMNNVTTGAAVSVDNNTNTANSSANVSAAANTNNASNATNSDDSTDKTSEAAAAINMLAASNQSSRVAQKYAAGQNLEDIPLVLKSNGYYNTASSSSSSNVDIDTTPSNTSKADLDKIYAAVSAASKKYGVSEGLILAIIKQESNFDSTSTSGVGASGLMQIMPSNFSSLGITDAYDVNQNIDGGTKLLKEYLDQYNGDVEMALMAYNGGPGTMQSRGVRSSSDLYKMPSETQNYVPKVMGYYNSGVRS